MSGDYLRELISKLEAQKKLLNQAIDEETTASHQHKLAENEVKKQQNNLKTSQEALMVEKKLIDAAR